jgi:ribonuclease HI
LKHVVIYTDGACKSNPGGPGGWGAILMYESSKKEISGAEKSTTNNRMELMAVIQSLSLLTEKCKVDLYTDSKYVKDGSSTWMHNWIKNNWTTADKKPVKNQDLWMALHALLQQHEVTLHWVRGHSGDPMNERADQLATQAIMQQLFHHGA